MNTVYKFNNHVVTILEEDYAIYNKYDHYVIVNILGEIFILNYRGNYKGWGYYSSMKFNPSSLHQRSID